MEQGRSWLEKLPNFHQKQLRNVSGFLLQQCYPQLDMRDGPKDFVFVPPRAVVVCCLCVFQKSLHYLLFYVFSLVVINCAESGSSFFTPFPTGQLENV